MNARALRWGFGLWLLAAAAVPAAAQTEAEREAERSARQLVAHHFEEEELRRVCVLVAYNEELRPPTNSTFLPHCDQRPPCRGVSLRDCMRGETICAQRDRGCWTYAWRGDRARIQQELDRLGALAPRSDWIIGQRVNFAVGRGQLARAREIAGSCEAASWWCQLLRGYVEHHFVQGSGDAALDSALASVPAGTAAWGDPRPEEHVDRGPACEWTHIAHLLTGTRLDEYLGRTPCSASAAELEAHFWWLADPLWSVPGNPRRSEHIVRNVQMALDEDLGFYAGPNAQASWLAQGLPNSWRHVERMRRTTPNTFYQFYVYGGYSFAPDAARFFDPIASTADDWALEWDEGEERMHTPEEWHNLEHHQTAVLRRGDRLLALSAARLPVIVSSFDSVRAALAMGRPADLLVEVAPAVVGPGGVIRASTELEDGEWVASVEIRGDGWRGRARYGTPAPALQGGFGISDPVLVDERSESGELPLADAILPSTSLSGGGRVGVYFEVYGVERDEPLEISVSAERTDRSLLSRITGALRLTSNVTLEVNWLESAETSIPDLMSRYLGVDLSGLDAGKYQIAITVESGGGATATSSRVVTLR